MSIAEYKIPIKELFKIFNIDDIGLDEIVQTDNTIEIMSPSGYVPINGFVKKFHHTATYVLEDDTEISCSTKHIIFDEGTPKHISKCNKIDTMTGSKNIVGIIDKGEQYVYDVSLNYPHKYVTPNGIIHHNTTSAKALCNELGYDVLVINGSNEGRLIDTLRTTIVQFASTVSFDGNRKCVIIDECLEENEKVRVGTTEDYKSIPLKDLEYNTQYPIVSFNIETGMLENDTGYIISDRDDEVFEITFDDNRTIKVNKKHPFIVKTKDGKYIQKSLEDGLNEYDEIVGV